MQAEILTIGTELLLGEIVDTNAAFIARRLAEIGVDLYRKTTVGDNEERIVAALRQALERADVVITTGGLGPTVDDVTREAVARATGRELVLDEALLASIEALFARWGRPMRANNRRQAYIPAGAIPIENPVGTAPAFIVEAPQGTVISLPGVPREMRYLLEQAMLPYLRQRMDGQAMVIRSKRLHVVGLGESEIDRRLDDLMHWENPTVGLAAKEGQVDIRIAAKATGEEEAERLIADAEAQVRARLGEHIYGEEEETLEGVVAALLAGRGMRLTVLESNTLGTVAGRLASAPQGPRVLQAGHLVLAPREAGRLLGLASLPERWEALVCQEVAEQGALHLRRAAGTEAALVVIGHLVTGATLQEQGKGESWVAVAWAERGGEEPAEVRSIRVPMGGIQDPARSRVATGALDLVRRVLSRGGH